MNALDLAVIHDAKNNMSSLLLRLENKGDMHDEMQLLLKTSNRLTNLILWHKEQDGDMRVNADSASPVDLLAELCSEYQQLFPNLKITYDSQAAPAFGFYDENYVRLALENAVHNACDYAKHTVSLSAYMQDGYLVFQVADDGDGYSDAILDNFAQKRYTEASHRGTGIGMMLSNAVAHMHKNKGRQGHVALSNHHGAVCQMFLP